MADNEVEPKLNDIRFRDQGQQRAHPASLDAYASSDLAKKVIAELAALILASRLKANAKARSKRGKSLADFERAIGAFVFEVLKAQSRKQSLGWFGLSLAAGAGTGEHISYRARKRVADGLNALGLIEVDPGKKFVSKNLFGDGPLMVRPGRTTRIKAYPILLEMLEERGLTVDNYKDHFIEDLPKRTIYLKARKIKNGSRNQVGKPMAVEQTDHVKRLENEVQAINRFVTSFALKGADFRGYKRRFNEGNAEDFNWNKGGRLYAEFQQLPAAVRKKFTIDGEGTAELDVAASYLTILHGIHGVPFDTAREAYGSDPERKHAIKAFINQSLGSPKLMTRWSKAWDEKFLESYGYRLIDRFRPKDVRELALALHPFLAQWGTLKTTWADLMFLESEAMIYAIKALMNEHEAPSYVVHDSLIVRERDLEIAKAAIEAGYKAKCGLTPKVRVKAAAEVDAKDLREEEAEYD